MTMGYKRDVGFLHALRAIRNPTYSNQAFRGLWNSFSVPDAAVE
jgi:hypothetical protein